MSRTRIALFIIAAICIFAIGVGSTLAVFTALSEPVINTFTVGKVEIALTETTGESYYMTPGATVAKDPKVTVKGGSEDCWLFVKVDRSASLDSYISYELSEGWVALHSQSGVYYRQVEKSSADTELYVLKNNSFTVKDSLDKTHMASITEAQKLTFTAYAIQSLGVDTAEAAWHEIQSSIQE